MKKGIQLCGGLTLVLAGLGLCSCEELDNDPNKHISDSNPEYIELQEVVEILTLLPISKEQLSEVHSAVSASSVNGYDEEECDDYCEFDNVCARDLLDHYNECEWNSVYNTFRNKYIKGLITKFYKNFTYDLREE